MAFDTVTLEDLVEVASAAGSPTDGNGFKRLRREGLMPNGLQRHVVGSRGSESRYPLWAELQLLGLIDLRIRRRQRPFEVLRFIAWEEGLWVDLNALRATVSKLVRESVSMLQRLGAADKADDTLAKRVSTSSLGGGARHPLVSEMLGTRTSDDTIRDAVTVFGQIAAVTEASDFAKDTGDRLAASLLPDEVAAEGDITAIWDNLDLPPAGKWPRIISRANYRHFENGRIALYAARSYPKPLAAKFFEADSIRAVRYRAATAAPWIVAAKVNPSIVDKYIPQAQVDPLTHK